MAQDLKRKALIDRVLSDPELYSDEFLSWLPRFIQASVNLRISTQQLPLVDKSHFVGSSNEAAFANSWANFGGGQSTVSYYKDPFNRVHLSGVMALGTMGVAAFNLPSGYRPQAREIFVVASNDAFGRVDVLGTGDVIPIDGSNAWVSLSGITFRAFG